MGEKQSRVEQAVERGEQGCSCSEAVLLSYGCGKDGNGGELSPELALRLASGLAGGIGRSGGVCGAVSAAVLALGLRLGPENLEDRAGRVRAMDGAGELLRLFTERHGSTQCRDLCGRVMVGLDMNTAEGVQVLRQSGWPERMIRSASELMEAVSGEEGG